MAGTKHILRMYHNSRDPDARTEVSSYCDVWEECSGSGKHSMHYNVHNSDCLMCIREFNDELREEIRRFQASETCAALCDTDDEL